MRFYTASFVYCFFFLTISIQGQELIYKHQTHYKFIENKGQWAPEILFKAGFSGGNLWIQQQKFVFHLQDFSYTKEMHEHPISKDLSISNSANKQHVVHLNFIGANKINSIEKKYPSDYYFNYFIGNNQSKWVSDVRGYGEATLIDFYDGIDLKIIEQDSRLKYEFHLKPNIDPNLIHFQLEGQQKVSISEKGDLLITTPLGTITEKKPYAFQIVNGKIIPVSCSFEVQENKVSFKLGFYRKNMVLVIDPILVFATYSGSVTDNFGMTATYGHDGSAYSAGTVFGNAYPTPYLNAYNVNSNFTVQNNMVDGITDVFISKYASDGTTMLWTTYLGGGDNNQGTETAHSLICDQFDNLYVYGATSSVDFPVVNGYQSFHAGGASNANFTFNGVHFTDQGTDIYVSKISADGHQLLASTYIGGTMNDGINTKVSSGIYNTVESYDSLTTNYGDQFRGEIMLDSIGNCIVATCTKSVNFPLKNAFQSNNAGMQDGVIFKLTSDLDSLLFSSYYGGSNNDACYSVKVDSSGNIVFCGGTSSQNLLFTSNGLNSNFLGGKTDGFVVKLNPADNTIVNASYIGTQHYDQAFFVEIDRNDNVFLVGQSSGGQFPIQNSNFVNTNSGQFVIKLNPTLTANLNSTIFGNGNGLLNISPSAFMVDICGNIYISGWGANILQGNPLSGMPVTTNAFQASPPNGFDFYLLVIDRNFNNMLYGTYLGGNQAYEHVDGGTSRFDKNGVVYQSVCGGCSGFSDFPTTPGAWSDTNLSTNCNNIIFKFDFQLIPKAQFSTNQTIGCVPFTVTLINQSSDSDSYLWDFGNGDTSSIIFEPTLTYNETGIYTINLYVQDSVCLLTDTAQIKITVIDSVKLQVEDSVKLCKPVPWIVVANTQGTANQFVWSSNSAFSDTLNENLADSTLIITPEGSGTFYIKAENTACETVDSVYFQFISSDLSLTGKDSLCIGENSTISAINTNPEIAFAFVWIPDSIVVSQVAENAVIIKANTSQYLFVTAQASNGCIIKDSVYMNVGILQENEVEASATDYIIPVGGSTKLLGKPSGMNYEWQPLDGLANPTSQNTQALINESMLYTLTVSDGICKRSDTVFIKAVEYICDQPFVYVPNAFTPNGDNENDILYVRGKIIDQIVFRIFDRWGELVFETTERNKGWDGTFRGKKLEPDVFDYYLKASCLNGTETIVKGNVTIMK